MLIELCLALWFYLTIITHIATLLGPDFLGFTENLDFLCRVETTCM